MRRSQPEFLCVLIERVIKELLFFPTMNYLHHNTHHFSDLMIYERLPMNDKFHPLSSWVFLRDNNVDFHVDDVSFRFRICRLHGLGVIMEIFCSFEFFNPPSDLRERRFNFLRGQRLFTRMEQEQWSYIFIFAASSAVFRIEFLYNFLNT